MNLCLLHQPFFSDRQPLVPINRNRFPTHRYGRNEGHGSPHAHSVESDHGRNGYGYTGRCLDQWLTCTRPHDKATQGPPLSTFEPETLFIKDKDAFQVCISLSFSFLVYVLITFTFLFPLSNPYHYGVVRIKNGLCLDIPLLPPSIGSLCCSLFTISHSCHRYEREPRHHHPRCY